MFENKQLEPICGNCKHLDDSRVLSTYPPKYHCGYYGIGVFWTDKCHANQIIKIDLDTMPPIRRYYIFDESE